MTTTTKPTFQVNVLTPAGAIPLDVELNNVLGDKPTIHDVLAQYEAEDRLSGWTENGQWLTFYPTGLSAIGERNPSRGVVPVKPTILRPTH